MPRAKNAGGENANLCLHVIASAAKQSMLQRERKDGLLRCARNDDLTCHQPRKRVIEYAKDASDWIEKQRPTGLPVEPGDDSGIWGDASCGPSARTDGVGGPTRTMSARLTHFWHCGGPYFSSRTNTEALLRQRTVNGFGRDSGLPKGLAMLIRSQMFGVQGKAAVAADPLAIPAASLPTRRLGGLLLLICP
jgi:hypothetical protein